ncbi:MAG: hypothetical protein HY291_20290 [Planctomycetes bacterium]|nr:hypothetical protein [Planctomycetota bacterium]
MHAATVKASDRPAPAGPVAPAKPPAPPATGAFGRSALWLYALAWLAALGTTFVVWVLGTKDDEVYTIQGVGGAAAFALAIWSAVIALRGYLRGELKRWTAGVLCVFLVELAWLGAWEWSMLLRWGGEPSALFTWCMWTALPVWGLYLGLAMPFAASLAWLRQTMAARRRARLQPQEEVWTISERRRFAAKWCALYLAAPAILLLPVTLFVFSALVIGMGKGVTWQEYVVAWTPDSIKRAGNFGVSIYDGPRSHTLQLGLVLGGDLPADELQGYLRDANPNTRKYAWEVLCNRHPQEALNFALREAPRSGLLLFDTQKWAGELVGQDGEDEAVEALLRDFDGLMPFFRDGLYRGLWQANRWALASKWDSMERERRKR